MSEIDIIDRAYNIKSIYVIKNNIKINIFPWNFPGKNCVEFFEITESIHSSVISGHIILKDVFDWSNELNVHSFGKIVFEYKNTDNLIKSTEFKIYSVMQVTNRRDDTRQNQDEILNEIRFDFTTDNLTIDSIESEIIPYGKDFVGYISTENNNGEIKGLINQIFSKLDIQEYEIEPTLNGIWIKSNEVGYPWGKSKGQLQLNRLFQYICSYAVSRENPNAVNYFLWRDMDGYHFKSLEKMITDNTDNIEIYFTQRKDSENAIQDVMAMEESNIFNLSKSNSFQAFYEKIMPNYDDFYLDFVDSGMSYKTNIVDLDYHRDFSSYKSIEKYKLIPDTTNTNTFIELGNNKSYIQSLRMDDNFYGYYEKSKLNSPFTQSWEYLGKTGESRWNDVNFIPQFDITNLDIETFHTIHKKIREPLAEKRKKLSRLKNIKKKWEVYRCSVCCLTDQQGGVADDAIIESLRNLPNPTQNPDYNFYFGITGIFGGSDGFENPEYKIAAAGSFTDVFNYDENQGVNRGLTLSWDENTIPYNKMHDFYALETGNGTEVGDGPQIYINNILNNGIKTYDKFIEFFQKQLTMCDEFLNNSASYISAADQYLTSILEDTENGNSQNSEYTVEIPIYNVQPPANKFFKEKTDFLYNTSADGSQCLDVDEAQCQIPCYGTINKFQLNTSTTLKLPANIFECSKSKVLGFRNINTNDANRQGFLVSKPISNIKPVINRECLDTVGSDIQELYENWSYNTVLFQDNQFLQDFFGDLADGDSSYLTVAGNFNLYNYYTNDTDKDFNPSTDFDIAPLIAKIENKLSVCYLCLDPIRLEILERNIKAHKTRCSIYLKYFEHMRNTIQDNFIPKWKEYYREYQNRKVYFISKKEDKIINNSIINSEISLFNIKSIQRKSIRGSRYEILSRQKGITGSEIGPYLYNIFFNDDETKDISISGNHPYYDQGLRVDDNASENKTLYPIKNIEKQFKVNNFYKTFDKPFDTIYSPTNYTQITSPRTFYSRTNNFYDVEYSQETGLRYSNYYLNQLYDTTLDISSDPINLDYKYRYNFYKLQETKIPSQLKREVLTSYVRIEFKNPIGLDSIVDFPDGFVRNAGFEYFLPYLVSLTSGPNGRQTIRQNAVVIGMDPYGFDVAMKRIPDNIKNGKNYWWNSGMEFPGMDLWPEVAFETQYPYYRTWDFDQEFSYNDGEKYGSTNSIAKTQFNNDHFSERSEAFNYKFEITNNSINSNGSRFDPTLINTNNNSNYNLNSSKYIKVHRNWWSFHHPQNIIIIPSIFSEDSRVFFGNKKLNSEFIDSIYNDTFYYWTYYNNDSDNKLIDDEFERELKFSNKFFEDIVDPLNNQDVDILKSENSDDRSLSAFKNNAKFEEVHPEIKAYFSSITNWWLSGDNIMYRPGLLTSDVWKYDISGYSEYGMVFPPTHQNHPDIFDNNFAAQFIVFARNQKSQNNICEKLNLKCVNPNGSQNSNGCPDNDPYCNCPAKNRIPTETEPSYLEIFELEQETKECALIEEYLGYDWLGCVWSNDQNTASCNCPEVGDKFMDYLEYSRTYATFWNTPDKTPLLRNSQMNLLLSNECVIEIKRNDKIKVGSIINLIDKNPANGYLEQNRRFSGKWLVSEIHHKYMNGMDEYMHLILNRDSLPKDPNQSKNPRILQ